MKVLFVASEADPFVKVGGLGDVAGTLPHALLRLPTPPEMRMVIPFHPQIDRSKFILENRGDVEVVGKKNYLASIYLTHVGDLPVYLIDGEPIQNSKSVYSADANIDGEKYIFFSLAVLELMKLEHWIPDVLHAHDWHTAPLVYALSEMETAEISANIRLLLTVHNLPYLGIGAEAVMEDFGLGPSNDGTLPEWALQTPLPLGLMSASHINTVSPGYAQEILTEPFGSGLHKELQNMQGRITGILNGLDLESWDPRNDKLIKQNYDYKSLEKRRKNKDELLRSVGMGLNEDVPLFGIVSRMDYQKGIDTAILALEKIADVDWQAIILGTGDPKIEQQAKSFADLFPGRVRVILKYDDEVARQIYAGSDMLLIPSRYEPCGLTQMIAMRYGSVPVAHAVGGLRDTIAHYGVGHEDGTGFLSEAQTVRSFADAMSAGIAVIQDKRRWKGIQRRGMQENFSWEKSAREYLKLYKNL